MIILSYGCVKKIDELGRIVIPMHIRKSLSIKTNDSLELSVTGNCINIEKNISIKNYDTLVKKYAYLFSKCNISILVTNRERIIFNNTNICNIDIPKLINMSLYELIEESKSISQNSDIRPIIIDSNVEGIVLITKSTCNKIVGELFNLLVTSQLDISC